MSKQSMGISMGRIEQGLRQAESGFTLAEILVGLGIMVVIFLSILTVIPFSYDYINRQKYRQIAINLCREKLEMIKDMDYYNIAIGDFITNIDERSGVMTGFSPVVTNPDLSEFPPPQYPSDTVEERDYCYSVKVKDLSNSNKMLKDIIVEVSYWEKNEVKRIVLETYIFGIQPP